MLKTLQYGTLQIFPIPSFPNYFMIILQLSQLIKCFQMQSHKLCNISEKIEKSKDLWKVMVWNQVTL